MLVPAAVTALTLIGLLVFGRGEDEEDSLLTRYRNAITRANDPRNATDPDYRALTLAELDELSGHLAAGKRPTEAADLRTRAAAIRLLPPLPPLPPPVVAGYPYGGIGQYGDLTYGQRHLVTGAGVPGEFFVPDRPAYGGGGGVEPSVAAYDRYQSAVARRMNPAVTEALYQQYLQAAAAQGLPPWPRAMASATADVTLDTPRRKRLVRRAR